MLFFKVYVILKLDYGMNILKKVAKFFLGIVAFVIFFFAVINSKAGIKEKWHKLVDWTMLHKAMDKVKK